MTSLERRREARYQRRKAKRTTTQQYDDYERAISYNALYKANLVSRKNVCWKASVQKYQRDLLKNLYRTHEALKKGQNISRGFVEFDLRERGKTRHIRSVHYSERVVQRSLCDNILVPALRNGLIYDNGACLEGKGVHWSLERLEAHLRRFYRENGNSNDGYIVCFDFKKYFDSIDHKLCFELYKKYFKDERMLKMLQDFIHPFGFPDKLERWTRSNKRDESQYTGRSLGLGSQISQITAVTYPNSADHYIKQDLHVRHYMHYMDDGFMLLKTKEEAYDGMNKVIEYCEGKLKLVINRKKTHVQKISEPFKFLKVTYALNADGSLTKGIDKAAVIRERRKLKKLAKKIAAGEADISAAQQSYGSWKGYALYRCGEKEVRQTDALFTMLFGIEPPTVVLKKKNKWRYNHG